MNPLILLIFIPLMMLIAGFPSHWDDNGITNDERIRLNEIDQARRVAAIEKRDSNSKRSRPSPRAERLDDGIQGDVPIKELMKGLKGFL